MFTYGQRKVVEYDARVAVLVYLTQCCLNLLDYRLNIRTADKRSKLATEICLISP